MEKLKVPLPVVVEGKYDRQKLSEVIDAVIITTDGFGIFNKKEKTALIRALSVNGIIVLADSDGAGGVIRSHIMSVLPADKVYNLYIPKIPGCEKRKSAPSREGTLGVEGMKNELLRELFSTFIENNFTNDEKDKCQSRQVTKYDFYSDGLSGREDSARRRDELAISFGLPDKMTANALLAAVNLLGGYEKYRTVMKRFE